MFEILDMYFTSSNRIDDGFKHILGIEKHVIVKNAEGKILCLFHDFDAGKAIVGKYLDIQGIDVNLVKFESITIRRKEERYKKLMQFKVVLLDNNFTLYKEIQKKATRYKIKGYKGKLPKYGINKYKTMEEI